MVRHYLPLLFLLARGICIVQASPTEEELQILIQKEINQHQNLRLKRAENQHTNLYSVLSEGSRMKRAAITSLTPPEQALLLTLHNDLRSSVVPDASNMIKMEWDDALAANAQTFADTCSLVHGLNPNIGGFTFVNENIDITLAVFPTKTLTDIFNGWSSKSSSYDYSTNTCSDPSGCGSYLQLIWAETQYVGCGQANCPSVTTSGATLPAATITICHYGEGGNNPSQSPYMQGSSCSACPSGYSCDGDGSLCEEDDPCASSPCQNGGQCSSQQDGSFSCACPSGYTGPTCENIENVFLICQTMPCQNGATCVDLPGGSFVCQCPPFYTGTFCEIEFICASQPCENGGTCIDSADATSYTCNCPAEYTGSNCAIFIPCSNSPCMNGGTCTDSADFSSYTCDCPSEYTGSDCELFIPCSNDPCQNGGTCTDSADFSSYTCDCPPEYTGTNCETRLPCSNSPCQNGGSCTDSVDGSSYTCDCPPEYTGTNCETRLPCSNSPCQNGGSCTDSVDGSSYTCDCPPEYTGTNCETRLPCSNSPCQNGGSCTDSVDGSSYTCDCPPEYTGTNCETRLPCSNSPCQNGGSCTDSVDGSSYTCDCPPEYTGTNCETRLPCSNNPCQNGGSCTDSMDGTSYTCDCPIEYTGQNCETVTRCSEQPCQNGATCTDSPDFSSYTCTCLTDYTGTNCETGLPCLSSPCQNGGTCSNNQDGVTYTCTCATGYCGDDCEKIDAGESGEYCTSESGEGCFLSESQTDDFDWTRRNSATPSGFTGPDSGAEDSDYFLYIEASSQAQGDIAILESTDYCFDDEHRCIAFYYHMFGIGTGKLRVQTRDVISQNETTLFELDGNQGNEWMLTGLEVSSLEEKEVIFEATVGSDHRSDIALDQIRILPGSCGCITNPCPRGRCEFMYGGYICNCPRGYEGADCTIVTDRELKCLFYNRCAYFRDSDADDFDWSRSGRFPTPTANTGPTIFPTGWYGYIESSGRSPGDRAVLSTVGNGLTFDNRLRCLSFSYHMYGDDIGSLQIYTGNSIIPIWEKSGNQGDVWISDAVTLPAVANLIVRIEGVVGSGTVAGDVEGDIAIDNVIITDGACPP